MISKQDEYCECTHCGETCIPELVNITGKYCGNCKKRIHEKALASRNMKYKNAKEDVCIWCGEKVCAGQEKTPHEKNIHAKCATHQAWLLKCIRYSNKPFRYIVSREEKYKEDRKKREKLAKKREELKREPDKNHDTIRRLNNMENMMRSLLEALGENPK